MSNTTTTKPKRTRTKKVATVSEPAVPEPVSEPVPEPKNEAEAEVEVQPQDIVANHTIASVPEIGIDENISTNNNNCNTGGFQPRLKTLETMERIKSKIEFFDATEHKRLLQSILAKYSELNSVCQTNNDNDNDGFCCDDHVDFKTKAFKEFERQVTQNQNGIFLNLTTCDDSLWQACVICVEQMEQQKMNLEILDKERQMEMAKIMQVQSQSQKQTLKV